LIQLFDVALQLDEMVDFIRCPRVRGLPPAADELPLSTASAKENAAECDRRSFDL
jgi:hypothetical protein